MSFDACFRRFGPGARDHPVAMAGSKVNLPRPTNPGRLRQRLGPDQAAAMDRLPGIAPERQADAPTGTTDSAPETLPDSPQPFCQQLERETGRSRAANRHAAVIEAETQTPSNRRGFHMIWLSF